MNFHSRHQEENLEVNLIPLIDVLLVILIFLAASTSFTKQRQLDLSLPTAQASELENTASINLGISKDSIFTLDGVFVEADTAEQLASQIKQLMGDQNLALQIEADAQSPHGSVVLALEAARIAAIDKIHFLTAIRP